MGIPDLPRGTLRRAYDLMRAAQGHQDWWPGDGPFEVCIGAILTQNTSWRNVEQALDRLKTCDLLSPQALHGVPADRLAELLRPAGCPSVKARRVRAFVDLLMNGFEGSLRRLFAGDRTAVRARLLEVPGIGPETADSMLLYAGGHRSFVVDAYLRRVMERHGWAGPRASYDALQSCCEAQLSGEDARGYEPLDLWQDFHAQVVAVGKTWCQARGPRCKGCPLEPLLPARGTVGSGA